MMNENGYHPTIVYSFYSVWLASTCYFIYKILLEKSYSRRMMENVKNRKQKCTNSFKTFREQVAESKIDDETIRRITSLTFSELRQALQTGELTPTKVQLAYADLICRVNGEVNCVTECIVESFDTAKNLEEKYGNSSDKPYLYGVPFSVKSNFHLRGYDCCIGLAKFLTEIKKENCTMVEMLIRLGAVPICITNVPQGLMSFMCSNPIFGTTENPHKKGFSPGGSSGGEACLVAKKGIPFGIGSDLAGSLRIPAQFSGVISMKPTEQRFGITNAHGGMPGKTRIGLSYGFFTQTVDEQIDLFNVVLNSEHYKTLKTPNSVYLKFDMSEAEKQVKNGLKIGYYKSNGFIQPVPACVRAVEEVVEKMKKQGHELIEFTVPNPMKMANLVLSNIACDGGAYWKEIFAGENIDPYMKAFIQMIKIPNFVRTMASYALSSFSPEMALMSGVNVSSSSDVRQMQEDTDIYREEFYKAWNLAGLDAMIAPAFPTTAIPHEYPAKLGLIAVETALYNVLDYPAGIVPVTKVTKDDIENLNNETIFSTGWNLTKLDMKKASQETENLPVGVQIITQPFEEEKCLAIMKQVQEIVGKIY